MDKIKWNMNRNKSTKPYFSSIVNREEMGKALHFHQTIPGYSPTPLHSLSSLGQHLGINNFNNNC